ncbi:MAG: helix-turn-helix domain-containing protein, partial [Clostridia bacterium]
EQIAKALASAREVISRQLKDFEEDGIVELGRGKIEIRDKDALKKLI